MMNHLHEIDKTNFNIIRTGVIEHIKHSAFLYDKADCLVLDIAPQDWSGAKEFYLRSNVKTLDVDSCSSADYIADITKNNSEIICSNSIDVVIMTEVLEHTLNPFNSINEIYRMLKKGGVLIMTTPFNFRIHGPLPDCWRFSKYGLETLLENFTSVNIEENGLDRFLFPVQYKTIAEK